MYNKPMLRLMYLIVYFIFGATVISIDIVRGNAAYSEKLTISKSV